MLQRTEDFTDFNDNDDHLIALCELFLEQERLMVCWVNTDTGLDEGLATAATVR